MSCQTHLCRASWGKGLCGPNNGNQRLMPLPVIKISTGSTIGNAEHRMEGKEPSPSSYVINTLVNSKGCNNLGSFQPTSAELLIALVRDAELGCQDSVPTWGCHFLLYFSKGPWRPVGLWQLALLWTMSRNGWVYCVSYGLFPQRALQNQLCDLILMGEDEDEGTEVHKGECCHVDVSHAKLCCLPWRLEKVPNTF